MQQHFWLICGVWCGVFGAAYARFQLRKSIEIGEFTAAEARSFALSFGLWVFVPCCLLWGIQLSIGTPATPEYFRWPTPQRYLALVVQVFVWLALLYWVFVRDGAIKLSRVLRSSNQSTSWVYSPAAVRIGVAALVLAGVGALAGTAA
jgi:hypothetical protein